MIKYILQPPFLTVPEENGFANEWEALCLKLLKLEKKSSDIERRRPPEKGIDLFFKEKKIAYQCKSVTGNSNLNITKARNSLESALKIQATLGWEKYTVCSNVNFTETEEKKLKEIYSDVDFKGKDYWVGLCEKFNYEVRRNFRMLVDIPDDRAEVAINKVKEHYSEGLKKKLKENSFKIFFYTELHDKVYELQVSPDFTIEDLKTIIRSLLDIPKILFRKNGALWISDFFASEGIWHKEEGRTLRELGIVPGNIFTYWINTTFIGNSGRKNTRNDMQMLTMADLETNEDKDKKIIENYIKQRFSAFDASFN